MKKMLNWIVTMFFVASIFCGVSCTASATDETPPAEVQGFVITEQDSYLLLSWINPLDEDFSGVEISMNPAEGSLDNPVNLKKDATECKVYGLQTEIEYNFTIKTFDKSENFSEGLSYSYTIEKEPEINEELLTKAFPGGEVKSMKDFDKFVDAQISAELNKESAIRFCIRIRTSDIIHMTII